MLEKKLYDIEVYKNFFCVGIRDYLTDELTYFEISEERNDIREINEFFGNYKGFLISFNGIHYDNMVIKLLLASYNDWEDRPWQQVCTELKYFSDKLIADIFDDQIKKLKYAKVGWIDIDLYLYWSKLLRISQKISLKGLGIQMGYPVVQDLPYSPDDILRRDQLPKLRTYNTIHDLGVLKMLASEMEGDIKLRALIYKDYKINAWSLDAPKIAGEVLLKDYCKKTGLNEYSVSKQRFERPTLYIKDCLKGFNPDFQLPLFQKLWEDVNNSVDSFSKDLHVNIGKTNIILTYGVGGLE